MLAERRDSRGTWGPAGRQTGTREVRRKERGTEALLGYIKKLECRGWQAEKLLCVLQFV